MDGKPYSAVGYSANNWYCALTTLRIAEPLRQAGWQFIEGNDAEMRIFPERVSAGQVVAIQREFARFGAEYQAVISRARAEHKPIVYDLDDLLFDLPPEHPDANNGYYDNALLPMLHTLLEADVVTVSTPALQAYYGTFNPNIRVLPNYLNDSIWTFRAPADKSTQEDIRRPIAIGYMGGPSHLPDLQMIIPALARIGQEYANRIVFQFFGLEPPAKLIEQENLIKAEWIPLDPTNYERFVRRFSQSECDIFIAPLADNMLNRCKSPIKFLEYSALGVAGVYSYGPPYDTVVKHGENGFLARSINDWYNYLRILIDEPAQRMKMGRSAQELVKRNWLLSDHACEWGEVYGEALSATPTAGPDKVAQQVLAQVEKWQRSQVSPDNQVSEGQYRRLREKTQKLAARYARKLTEKETQVMFLQAAVDQQIADKHAQSATLHAEISRQRVEKNTLIDEKSRLLDNFNFQLAERNGQLNGMAQFAATQNKLIQDLLNGRVMRLMIGAQTMLQRARGRNVSRPEPPPLPSIATTPLPAEVAIPPASANAEPNLKQLFSKLYESVLDAFLASGQKLTFEKPEQPVVSMLLPMNNRAELSLQVLRTLPAACSKPYELIIFDNASTDRTHELLDRIEGATIIRNPTNLNFLVGGNRAVQYAHGEYILFLNNDIQLLPGAVDSALRTIGSSNDIGVVGGKIILLDGKLQEAGSVIWNDGSCIGYGRGDSPTAPMYMYQRDVDYCSGAFLLTRRDLWEHVGGFDETLAPAYYEETDYCLTLWEMGQRVVYDPDVIFLHYESAAYEQGRSLEPAFMSLRNRAKVISKHASQLKLRQPPDSTNMLIGRTAPNSRRRVLFIDDRVPHAHLGSGFPRSRDILLAMLDLGYEVTFYPLTIYVEEWESVYRDIPKTVEVIAGYGEPRIEEFLRDRKGYYDIILVSRPHNLQTLQPILRENRSWLNPARIIYDAEAIFAQREAQRRKLKKETVTDTELNRLVQQEVSLTLSADAVVCVSDADGAQFGAFTSKPIYRLGHMIDPVPTTNSFSQRNGFLFVGGIYGDDTSNADAVYWFATEILPLLQKQLDEPVTFSIAGQVDSKRLSRLKGDSVRLLGKVPDLTPVYNQARVFVAPARFAAGIPYKMHHAAAHGLPMVCTPLLAGQLGWQGDTEVLIGQDADDFAQQCARLYRTPELWMTLRENALRRIQQECTKAAFQEQVKRILEGRRP